MLKPNHPRQRRFNHGSRALKGSMHFEDLGEDLVSDRLCVKVKSVKHKVKSVKGRLGAIVKSIKEDLLAKYKIRR